jgi:uncharacterized protein YbjT (DUF2867 family)
MAATVAPSTRKDVAMQVLVIGATGGTGRRLSERLLDEGHGVRAMTRDAARAAPLADRGAEVVEADLEGDLDEAITGDLDAVVFCAGSGSSTGPDMTLRIDLHGAVRTVDRCLEVGVDRYVMLSSMAADDPLRGRESIRHYLAAKHAADRVLLASELRATVVRPGGLTDEEGTGLVTLGVPRLQDRGSISRADTAAVLAGCLERPATIGATFEVVAGQVPVAEALDHLPR